MSDQRVLTHDSGLESVLSADRLASKALQQEKGTIVTPERDRQVLVSLNQLDELRTPKCVDRVVKLVAIIRSAVRRRQPPVLLQEDVFR